MSTCATCTCHTPLDFDIRMAFQPIVNVNSAKVFAYEALVRGSRRQLAG